MKTIWMFIFLPLIILFQVQCTSAPKKASWLLKSDQIAEEYTFDFAKLQPEGASSLGYQQYDKLGSQPSLKNHLARLEKLKQWKEKLSKKLQDIHDVDLKIDLEILLAKVDLDIKNFELAETEKHIPVHLASQNVFYQISALVNDQFTSERQRRAVDRFKFYMSGNNKETYVNDLKKLTSYYQKKYEGKTGPYSYPSAERINSYLKNSPSYVAGIQSLLQKTGRSDWHDEFQIFEEQILAYNSFLETDVLPLAPRNTQLSRRSYELRLQRYGNVTSPDHMISEGRKQFQLDYIELKGLAKEIAQKHKLKNSNPSYINEFLKENAVQTMDEAKALYHQADQRLESLIRQNHLVTLPKGPLVIRIASEAESKATPVPHLDIPPLLNNKGEVPEFIVPAGSSEQALPYDDFSHHGMALALTAHEGRPGHDLQFRHILNQPMSLIRANYAFNSVNVEGWALYAEQMMFPYLTAEEKFSNLQSKMWRVARYFLDPMIHLGQANKRFVLQVLHKQLGLSEALAITEYERYSFRSPGQAPSYYQGLLNIYKLKQDIEERHGLMEPQCFHDKLLSFGLLPHDKISLFHGRFVNCKKR